MSFQLRRNDINPLLFPDSQVWWERENIFNPSVIYHNGLFHMHYRAQGADWTSRIGYAVSSDGVHFNRLREPVLIPADETEALGVEDPRVTEIEGIFYMTYTAYGKPVTATGRYIHGAIRPMFARSRNLIQWERIAPLVVGEDNKDHVLFPRKIGGRFACLHRRRPMVWLAYSDDLSTWKESDMAEIYGPRREAWWDNKSVGNNGVPIETDQGWLCINHAYDHEHIYRLGVVLLDLEDPSRVIHRPADPIFAPEELWETRGDVPNVVFSNGNVVVGDEVYVYYGGADHVIGLATCALADLVDYALHG